MDWIYDDGGRANTGRKGDAGDCVTRAISIAAQLPYGQVYEILAGLHVAVPRTRREVAAGMAPRTRSARNGIAKPAIKKFLTDIGWNWTPIMKIGSGCTVHLETGELPLGRLICSLSKHYAAVIDGVIHDTYDPSRDGTRCVYGYWQPPVR
jgi:hypothetical protein